MKTDIIKAIFTNLLFVIGIILLIFGFIQGSLTATRLVVFDTYPLDSYEETRCEYDFQAPTYSPDGKQIAETNPEEVEKKKEACRKSIEQERKVRKTEDIVRAITTIVSGAILVMSFKKFIFFRSDNHIASHAK